MPSYSMEPGSGYSRPFGPFLPRPPETFTSGAFGPMSPILPVPIDQPPEGFDRAQPRRQQLYVGYNLPVGMPGSEGYRLTSYATLKTLSDTYSILRACLGIRKNEIRALDWDIALTPDAANAYQGDREAMRDFGERKAKAKKFFQRPDSDYDNFESWLYALTEQLFVYDAVSVYMCPKKGTGLGRGLLRSDLDELWLIDGSSFRPLVGLHGERPRPPAPAYQQFEFGVPRADLTVMEAGLDLDGSEGRLRAMLRGDQLMYRPYERRPGTPYGFSLVEQALIPIMTGLRKQAYQLDFFNEKTVPAVYISPGDTSMTATQIRELQEALNSVAGDLAWSFKIQVLPPNSKVIPQKEMQIVDDSDNWIANEVAMILNVAPTEINLLPKVSAMASPFAAREMAQASRTIHERTATKPTLSYLAAIPDFILQVVCGQDDMRFVFEGMEQTQDLAALTDMGIKQVQSGVKTIDEFRDDLHMTRFNLPETRSPVVFTQLGPIPLGQAAAQARQLATGTADAGAGHRAVSGTPQRKALPAGTSGQGRMNGPVTQRQARRGGALAPAHATGEGAPGHSGGKPAPKAVLAELAALERHLNKGMHASEWVPVHIPGDVMAIITEDLGKGLSARYVVETAMKAHKAPPQQQSQRQVQQQLATQYQQQVQAAFASAISQAQALIAQWIAGTLAVTAAVLAGMIADLIALALAPVLAALWTAAWDAAVRAAGGDPADLQAELDAFLASEGRNWASLISGTGLAALLAAITAALRAGDVTAILDMLWSLLGVDQRSESIAVSETTRAWNAGWFGWLKRSGVAHKRWITRNDSKVCARCMANQRQGAIPLDSLFKSGDLLSPIHPNCRCEVVAAQPPPFTGKRLRREVGLNGQETWTEWEPQPDYSGGRVFQPHRADGTMTDGSPGAMTGGEPPRWDGTEPDPVVEHAPDADDDAAYGATGRPEPASAYWPMAYMDGWFPSPAGHGTGQPPSSSPGAATGRPPSPAGKASKPSKAAAFLKGAPKAKASAVRAAMRDNFPDSALGWVGNIRWVGPVEIPLDLLDFSHSDEWAARHQQGHVDDIARDIQAGKQIHPIIAVVRAGHNHARLIDGRHRSEAYRKLGRPAVGFVGFLDDANEKAAYDTYHQQFHSGNSPQNKSFTAGNIGVGSVSGLVPLTVEGQKVSKQSVNYRLSADPARSCGTCSMFEDGACSLVEGRITASDVCDRWEPRAAKGAGRHDESCLPAVPLGRPYCAGLVVRAGDTGRLLMIQRAASESDDGAGLLEWPGGHADDGESLLAAAFREFEEEVGLPAPMGLLTGHWESSNGVYAGFVVEVPGEADLDLGARDLNANPDGDAFLSVIWVDPAHLGGNRAVRQEVLTDLPMLQAALAMTADKSARTPMLSTTHNPLGPHSLWHTPDRHVGHAQSLPDYIENVAHALERDGHSESSAIALAIAAVRAWSQGHAFGGRVKVTAEVRAAASAALAEWERLKESHH